MARIAKGLEIIQSRLSPYFRKPNPVPFLFERQASNKRMNATARHELCYVSCAGRRVIRDVRPPQAADALFCYMFSSILVAGSLYSNNECYLADFTKPRSALICAFANTNSSSSI
jgi:hypothetical protein